MKKLGIVGAAQVGKTLAREFSRLGHQVMVASRRDVAGLADELAAQGIGATAANLRDVLACDVVFLAVPWMKTADVLRGAPDWNGRILVDATNIFTSYAPDFARADLGGSSGSETLAALAADAYVVKAFNTLPFDVMFSPAPAQMKRVLFVAGDRENAVETVAALIGELGFAAVRLGGLATAGRQMELGGPFSGLELFVSDHEGS